MRMSQDDLSIFFFWPLISWAVAKVRGRSA